MSNQREKLFTEFPPVSTQEWMEKITADLKGADFQKKLVWRTNEGFDVNPFYREENIKGFSWLDNLPGQFPYVRSTRKNNIWYVRHEIDVKDFVEANQKALKLLAAKIFRDAGLDEIDDQTLALLADVDAGTGIGQVDDDARLTVLAPPECDILQRVTLANGSLFGESRDSLRQRTDGWNGGKQDVE